jgi:LmbE family N-acetylglucosaminyl deacetylase
MRDLGMREPLRLMCVLAHPDDETLGMGGVLAKYASEGVQTYLVTATRGERGWKDGPYPGPEEVARHRTEELHAAARTLGIRQVGFLDYKDGELDRADVEEAACKIAQYIRRVRPQVVVTFGPDGVYGHEDHIAVSQLTTAAISQAASSNGNDTSHQVAKLYYLAFTRETMRGYEAVFGIIKRHLDGVERRFSGWDDWLITTRIDTRAFLPTVRMAVRCHRSQLRDLEAVLALPHSTWERAFAEATFYRAFSLAGGGREVESDLFAGVRTSAILPRFRSVTGE